MPPGKKNERRSKAKSRGKRKGSAASGSVRVHSAAALAHRSADQRHRDADALHQQSKATHLAARKLRTQAAQRTGGAMPPNAPRRSKASPKIPDRGIPKSTTVTSGTDSQSALPF